jgi:hypothetical protein
MTDRPIYYLACPDCKKKVSPNDNNMGYYCEKCQKAKPDCKPTYNFTVGIGDFTTRIFASVLGEQVGEQMLGMSARDIKALIDMPPSGESSQYGPPISAEFKQVLDKLKYSKSVFLIKAKMDTYSMGSDNQENRVRYTIVKQLDASLREENHMLLQRLSSYEKKRF